MDSKPIKRKHLLATLAMLVGFSAIFYIWRVVTPRIQSTPHPISVWHSRVTAEPIASVNTTPDVPSRLRNTIPLRLPPEMRAELIAYTGYRGSMIDDLTIEAMVTHGKKMKLVSSGISYVKVKTPLGDEGFEIVPQIGREDPTPDGVHLIGAVEFRLLRGSQMPTKIYRAEFDMQVILRDTPGSNTADPVGAEIFWKGDER